MKYLITTEVFDKDNKSVDKKYITEDSSVNLTVAQLKELGGKSNYTNIDTDEFLRHGKGLADNELVTLPFIYYKIKLK
jgi:hypothetical protein